VTPSPRCNRVTPYGARIAIEDRGLLWGNRGALHDPDGTFVRYSRGKGWVICALEFKCRRRQLMAPGRLSELFFLDEATALAAGHRRCGKCWREAYRAFKAACFTGASLPVGSAPEMDTRLHADRLLATGVKRMYDADLDDLPSGSFIEFEGDPWLVLGERLLHWTSGGYDRDSRALLAPWSAS
jgi:hypothetical protein